jgi:type IV secretion system protein VirD4
VRGNLGYLLVFPSTEHRTAEEISKLLGDQTLYVETRSRSSADSLFASRRTTTLRDQRRPLLTPDEVRRLSNDTPILLATGAFPILNRMAGYYALRRLRRRTRLLPPLRDGKETPDVRSSTEGGATTTTTEASDPAPSDLGARPRGSKPHALGPAPPLQTD